MVALGLSFLLSNGLTSINVELVMGKLHTFIISNDDLHRSVVIDTLLTFEGRESQLASPWNKSYAETAIENPMLNTALRTHFLPFQKRKTNCTGESLDDSSYTYPTVVAITPTESWVEDSVSTAIAPNESYSLSPRPVAGDRLPIDTSTMRTLFAFALIGLTTGDNALWPSEQRSRIVTSINQAIESQSNTPNCAVNESTTYGTLLDCVPDEILPNVTNQAFESIFQSTINSSANFSIHRLADSINFTSLTINYSIKLANDTKSGDQLQCSEDGCTFVDTEDTLKRGDQMVGIARLPGGVHAAERLVVRSAGKRLEGDSFDVDETKQNVVLTGLRMHYTITVGLLDWKIESLNEVLGTECGATHGCEGLRVVNSFLGKWQIALAGKSALDFSDLPKATKSLDVPVISSLHDAVSNKPTASPWIRIVSVINNSPHVVIALPRHFSTVGKRVADYLAYQDSSTCVASVARLLKAVEVNHLYIEDSLQIGYTAAFHYLLQNTVIHSVTDDGVVVFRKGEQELRIMASIEEINAGLSFIGCAVLFVMCVAVAISHKRSKSIIEANSSPTNIAQAMLNDSMYPRAVLSLWLEQSNGDDKTTARRVKLDDVVFERVEFKDKPKPEAKKSRKSVSTTV